MHTPHLLTTISETYGDLIWSCARRYRLRTLSDSDVYQEVLLACYRKVLLGKIDLYDKQRMRSAIISAAIDCVRRELKHCRPGRNEPLTGDERLDLRTGRHIPQPTQRLHTAEFIDKLRALLSPSDFRIVFELLFPSFHTQYLAVEEAVQARADSLRTGRLRMNCSDPYNAEVQKRHVAVVVGCSASRVSKALANARALLPLIFPGE